MGEGNTRQRDWHEQRRGGWDPWAGMEGEQGCYARTEKEEDRRPE